MTSLTGLDIGEAHRPLVQDPLGTMVEREVGALYPFALPQKENEQLAFFSPGRSY